TGKPGVAPTWHPLPPEAPCRRPRIADPETPVRPVSLRPPRRRRPSPHDASRSCAGPSAAAGDWNLVVRVGRGLYEERGKNPTPVLRPRRVAARPCFASPAVMISHLRLLALLLLAAPPTLAAAEPTPEQVRAGVRAFFAKTAAADGSFRPGLDPDYEGMA